MLINNELIKSRNYAILHHGEQKFDIHPFSYHLDLVFEISKKFGLSDNIKIASFLHDLIEDTHITKEDLSKEFNIEISNLVFAVSGFGLNRKEKQKNIASKIENNIDAINLKMCDRLANLMCSKKNKPSLFKKYCEEYYELNLNDIFSKGDTKLFLTINKLVSDNYQITTQPNKGNKHDRI